MSRADKLIEEFSPAQHPAQQTTENEQSSEEQTSDNQTSGESEQQSEEKPNLDELLKQVEELAMLNPLQYEQLREEKAKELKVRTSVLDKEVANKRKQQSDEYEGHDELLEGIEP